MPFELDGRLGGYGLWLVGGADVGGADVGGAEVGGAEVGGAEVGGAEVGGAEVGSADAGAAMAKAATAAANAASSSMTPGRKRAEMIDITGAPRANQPNCRQTDRRTPTLRGESSGIAAVARGLDRDFGNSARGVS